MEEKKATRDIYYIIYAYGWNKIIFLQKIKKAKKLKKILKIEKKRLTFYSLNGIIVKLSVSESFI